MRVLPRRVVRSGGKNRTLSALFGHPTYRFISYTHQSAIFQRARGRKRIDQVVRYFLMSKYRRDQNPIQSVRAMLQYPHVVSAKRPMWVRRRRSEHHKFTKLFVVTRSVPIPPSVQSTERHIHGISQLDIPSNAYTRPLVRRRLVFRW